MKNLTLHTFPGILWPLACICDHGPDTGIYRVCRRYSLIKNPVPASDSIYPCRHILFVCICQPDLCNGSDIQTHRKSTCRSSGDLTDPRIFRNVSDRDDTGIFQKLHPLLPFSYGIGAMRECIAGYYGHTYAKIWELLRCFCCLLSLSAWCFVSC